MHAQLAPISAFHDNHQQTAAEPQPALPKELREDVRRWLRACGGISGPTVWVLGCRQRCLEHVCGARLVRVRRARQQSVEHVGSHLRTRSSETVGKPPRPGKLPAVGALPAF